MAASRPCACCDASHHTCAAPNRPCTANRTHVPQERLFDQSDAYRVHVCEKSGLFAVANLKKQQFSSRIDKDANVVQVGRHG